MDPEILNAFAPEQISEPPSVKKVPWRWILCLTLFLGSLVYVGIMRNQLLVEIPALALACRALGIPIEIVGEGLEVRDVTSSVKETEQGLVMVLSGRILNVTNQPRLLPPLKIFLMPIKQEGGRTSQDAGALKHPMSWSHRLSQSKLLPNESLLFETEAHPIQDGEFQIDVRFEGAPR
jgi:hypothetical protein